MATPSKPTKCDGPDQDRDVERAIAQQTVRVGGDRTRVHQAGMGRDQRGEITGDVAGGAVRLCEVTIHCRG